MLGNIKEDLIEDLKPTSIHDFIICKVIERKEEHDINIKRKELVKILIIYNIPKTIHDLFIKELEMYNLIKIVDKQNIEIAGVGFEPTHSQEIR